MFQKRIPCAGLRRKAWVGTGGWTRVVPLAIGLLGLAAPVPSVARQETAPPVEPVRTSAVAVAWDSVFGPLRPEAWRPLGLGGLLTDGWDEPYAPASADAPRQTWINNADGAFYRLYVLSFALARDLPGGSNAFNGSAILFTPLSRRLELGWFVPFVSSAPDAARPAGGHWTSFGDLTIAPRVLLAEDRRYSLTTNLFVRLPTGDARNGNGVTSLSPDVEFWANPVERWVVRGGMGVTVPTHSTPASVTLWRANPWTGFNASPSPFTSFDARLAIGRYLTTAESPGLKHLVFDVAANLHTELSGGRATDFSLTPGLRAGIGRDWYALAGLEVPVVGPVPFATQTIVQLVKNF